MAMQLPAVGSWVRIHQPGFWQVYRVLAEVRELDPADGKIRSRPLVFVRRFVSDTFRPASAQACCDLSLVKPLAKRDAQKLAAFIQQNPVLVHKFAAMVPPPIDAVYNVRYSALKGTTAAKLTKWLSSLGELTIPEISRALSESQSAANSQEWLLQFRRTAKSQITKLAKGRLHRRQSTYIAASGAVSTQCNPPVLQFILPDHQLNIDGYLLYGLSQVLPA